MAAPTLTSFAASTGGAAALGRPGGAGEGARRLRLGKLRWHCRRALLELDLVFQRFWARQGDQVDETTEAALEKLLAMEDHDMWQLVSGRTETSDPQLAELVQELRRV